MTEAQDEKVQEMDVTMNLLSQEQEFMRRSIDKLAGAVDTVGSAIDRFGLMMERHEGRHDVLDHLLAAVKENLETRIKQTDPVIARGNTYMNFARVAIFIISLVGLPYGAWVSVSIIDLNKQVAILEANRAAAAPAPVTPAPLPHSGP